MVRRKFQSGSLFKRGKRRKLWVARWWEDMIRPDNSLGRVRRSEVLGPVSEIPSQREARKLLEVRLRSINQGTHRPQSTLHFEQFVRDHWEPGVLPLLKPSSAKWYGLLLRRHVLPFFGRMPLCEIQRREVQTYLVGKRKAGCSSSYVQGLRTVLSKVLQTALEWGYLETNPVRGIRLGGYAPVRELVVLSPQQVQQLLAALPEPCRTIVLLLVLTGLRIGELLALRWKHVDLSRGVIRVQETVSANGCFGTPKTRSSKRDVPMSAPVIEALLSYQQRCDNYDSGTLLFTSRNRTPLNYTHLLARVLHPMCKRLGLPPATWHSFRHTHGTLLGEVGESLRTAQAILGHSDLDTTLKVYTHPIPESQRRAVEKVAELLDPIGPKLAETEQDPKRLVN